jgi:hypothetical protein
VKNVRAQIECKDGFWFSIVANPYVMCTDPAEMRDGVRHWRDVELAYPSEQDEILQGYASPGPASRRPETYDYVPIGTLKDLVKKHGGVRSTTKSCRVCDRT